MGKSTHHKVDIEAKVVDQDAADDVGRDIVAGVAEMAEVVGGRAAGVPRDLALLAGHKGHRRAGLQRVVDVDGGHVGGSRCPRAPGPSCG